MAWAVSHSDATGSLAIPHSHPGSQGQHSGFEAVWRCVNILTMSPFHDTIYRMTKAQKSFIEIQKRQSSLRGEFNELRGVETRSAEQDTRLTEIDGQLTVAETEFRTAADALLTEQSTPTAGPAGEDAEARERRELCVRANVGDVVKSILEKRGATDGATAEAQAAFGLAPNQIPIDMLRAPVEHRAVTPTPGATGATQSEIVPPVFATGEAAFFGVDRPTVPQGTAVFPVLESRPTTGGPHADSTDVPDTTGDYEAVLLPPLRIQNSFKYRRSDAAQFSMMDESLRGALNGGLSEKLDYEFLRGTQGLLTGTVLANHAKGSATTYAQYLSEFCYARVDGRFAVDLSDVRVILGSATFADAGATYQSTPINSALDAIMAKTGGVRVSAHVPIVANSKQNGLVRLGLRKDYCQPLWQGITVIVDEISGSGLGEIELTAVMLMNSRLLRASAFFKQETNHS